MWLAQGHPGMWKYMILNITVRVFPLCKPLSIITGTEKVPVQCWSVFNPFCSPLCHMGRRGVPLRTFHLPLIALLCFYSFSFLRYPFTYEHDPGFSHIVGRYNFLLRLSNNNNKKHWLKKKYNDYRIMQMVSMAKMLEVAPKWWCLGNTHQVHFTDNETESWWKSDWLKSELEIRIRTQVFWSTLVVWSMSWMAFAWTSLKYSVIVACLSLATDNCQHMLNGGVGRPVRESMDAEWLKDTFDD